MVIQTRFKLSGLARLVSPFCLMLGLVVSGSALAQDYVDLEAERAAAKGNTATQPRDPYSSGPATSYPATSYGVNSAAVVPISGSAQAAPATSQGQSQNLGNLFYQLQELQQEVRMLNGKVEEQAHELRQLKKQSLDRYVDIDRRLAGGGAASVSPLTSASESTAGANTVPKVASPVAVKPAAQVGESDAYRSAYALVRSQKFTDATAAFKQFLQEYPAGKFAPNAHYWLGELYLVAEPPDLESSRQAFALLLSQYPTNSKAPDATYKLGKVHFMKGNRERAREYFDRVISQYGGTNSSAVKLARDFIAENY